jgi:hypothetical protein
VGRCFCEWAENPHFMDQRRGHCLLWCCQLYHQP